MISQCRFFAYLTKQAIPLEQQVLNIPQCQPVADVHHSRKADDLLSCMRAFDMAQKLRQHT